jgi:3-methyladenine DNA glycosylase AlkD
MPTVTEIMTALEANGSESLKKILVKHGIKEPFFGVKIEYLKTIEKKVKMDYQLAKDLYATGNADAMYLAGLIADDKQMSKADLNTWVKEALSDNINGYTVPWVTAGSNYGYELSLEWIDSKDERIAAAGWNTLGNWVALKADSELDIAALRVLLGRAEQTIHSSVTGVIKAMNNFIIAIGTYVPELTDEAIKTANSIGIIKIDTNGIVCNVQNAVQYIAKAQQKGTIGKKKKTVKC